MSNSKRKNGKSLQLPPGEPPSSLPRPGMATVLGTVILAAAFLFCLWLTLRPVPAADTWWMLKSGELICDQKKIPATDPFSYTATGLPWTNHEWLVGVIFFLISSAGGLAALYGFKSIMVIAAYGIVTYLSIRRAGGNLLAGGMAVLLCWQ